MLNAQTTRGRTLDTPHPSEKNTNRGASPDDNEVTRGDSEALQRHRQVDEKRPPVHVQPTFIRKGAGPPETLIISPPQVGVKEAEGDGKGGVDGGVVFMTTLYLHISRSHF